jgi:hypothetical protein
MNWKDTAWIGVSLTPWYILAANHWYSMGANAWYTMPANGWYIIARKMTGGSFSAKTTTNLGKERMAARTEKFVSFSHSLLSPPPTTPRRFAPYRHRLAPERTRLWIVYGCNRTPAIPTATYPLIKLLQPLFPNDPGSPHSHQGCRSAFLSINRIAVKPAVFRNLKLISSFCIVFFKKFCLLLAPGRIQVHTGVITGRNSNSRSAVE